VETPQQLSTPLGITRQLEEPEFRRLFQEHAPFVWRALRRLGVRERDAEDLLQEVFVVVHRKLPEFAGRASMTTWIYGICLRKALDYRRLARMAREVEPGPLDRPFEGQAQAPTQERELEVKRARGRLDAILDGLDDDKRAVFVLFELEGLTMNEIASLMGTPVQTAYARLYAARRHVKQALGQPIGDEP
jgi:RNA polymerase sigma-70 factor (ECF subfamily)